MSNQAFLKPKFLRLNDTLTSGITKSNGALPICEVISQHALSGLPGSGVSYRTILKVNTLAKAISADAAEAFGEHIASFPEGVIRPLGAAIRLTSLCPTGLSATAGEVGLGTTIASGAAATLGGTAAFENIMEGTTLSNHVAATTLTSNKANDPIISGTHSATFGSGALIDGSGTAAKIHLNLASTWNQTAAETFTFSARIALDWQYLGDFDF